jgi:hypothetical protein
VCEGSDLVGREAASESEANREMSRRVCYVEGSRIELRLFLEIPRLRSRSKEKAVLEISEEK